MTSCRESAQEKKNCTLRKEGTGTPKEKIDGQLGGRLSLEKKQKGKRKIRSRQNRNGSLTEKERRT